MPRDHSHSSHFEVLAERIGRVEANFARERRGLTRTPIHCLRVSTSLRRRRSPCRFRTWEGGNEEFNRTRNSIFASCHAFQCCHLPHGNSLVVRRRTVWIFPGRSTECRMVSLWRAFLSDTGGRAGGRCSVKASKRVVLEKQQNGILFMKRPPARWSSSQDLKQSLSSQKEKSSTNHEAPPISRDPRRVVRAGRLPLLPRRPRGGEFFVHERSGGRGPTAYIHTAVGTIHDPSRQHSLYGYHLLRPLTCTLISLPPHFRRNSSFPIGRLLSPPADLRIPATF